MVSHYSLEGYGVGVQAACGATGENISLSKTWNEVTCQDCLELDEESGQETGYSSQQQAGRSSNASQGRDSARKGRARSDTVSSFSNIDKRELFINAVIAGFGFTIGSILVALPLVIVYFFIIVLQNS